MQHEKIRKFIYSFLKVFVAPFLWSKVAFKTKPYTPKAKQFIILSNHCTDLDMVCLPKTFKEHIYFVASEHIGKGKLSGKLIDIIFAPVRRLKSSSDLTTIKRILKYIKDGANICIFAEGGRCPEGRTSYISEASAKLIKLSKLPLITYRFKGGYFTQPRWATHFRKGSLQGEVVAEYSAEKLSSLSLEEINFLIHNDLNEDAYKTQEKHPVAYRGKALAESIECVLYLCPVCHKMDVLHSHDDIFECECSLKLRYTPYGYLESCDEHTTAPFSTISGWYDWQEEQMKKITQEYFKSGSDKPLTSDSEQQLKIVTESDRTLSGSISAYKDRLEFSADNGEKYSFGYNEITDTDVADIMTFMFTVSSVGTFMLYSKKPRSPYKYAEIINALRTDGKLTKIGRKE